MKTASTRAGSSGRSASSGTEVAVAVVGIGAFVVWELRHENPLINLRALSSKLMPRLGVAG